MKKPWRSKKAKELANKRTSERYAEFSKKHGRGSRFSGKAH